MDNKKITDLANACMLKIKKKDFAYELGISIPTIASRIENNSWKISEGEIIVELYNDLCKKSKEFKTIKGL